MERDRGFDPEKLLRTLTRHEVDFIVVGGIAGTLHGSEYVTYDLDITPDPTPENFERLRAALVDLDGREANGVSTDLQPEALAAADNLKLITSFGRLDVAKTPAGTRGYRDLQQDAIQMDIGRLEVVVASLADVVRSKEAAGREKDLLTVPTLRRLLDEQT